MADLILRTARTTIEQALTQTILEGFKARLPAVADVTALRALASAPLPQDTMVFCTAAGFCYRFYRNSTAADNGTSVIKPTDVGNTQGGRWILTGSSTQSGYLKVVRTYYNELTVDGALKSTEGQRPSALIYFTKGEHEPQSTSPGALYWYRVYFDILVVGSNARNLSEVEQGSPFASEVDAGPGVNQILGDLKALLAGSTLGNLTGVVFTEIKDETRLNVAFSERAVVEKLSILVTASVQNPDTGLVTISNFDVQKQLADTPAGPLSSTPTNQIVSGYTVALGSGLTKAPAAGSAYVGTTLVSSTPIAFTFPANQATYRDLKTDGTFVYQSVGVYDAPPSVTANALRVGVTLTDSSGVVFDRLLADSLINFGPVDSY